MIADKLKEIREKTGMNKKEFAKYLDIKYTTYNNYETGAREPASDFLILISKKFDVSIDYLMGLKDEAEILHSYPLSSVEFSHIENYRRLDQYGQKTIDLILERELDRYKQFQQLQHKKANLTVVEVDDEPAEDYGENVVMMPTFMQKLCAGTGSIGDDVQLENEAYPAIRVPAGAQYAATVAGDSMEPEYSDGDVVFFNDTNTPRFGDIVVLSINKENYLKKYTERGFEALNPKYDILVPGESDFVVVLGKVLGKL
ncbi:helix-turn-helix domain-containing protein [Eubacterium limosum]|uniref:XRE family transcriptional regulator n=1 Tax=Eubacterium limosum TaxID=1736 RepID=A0ABT5UUT0_EUBLI|nr:XRE family transcriptional regulator [Eubacterium limosum]MDE1472722.1 XRE family transcriptional regulator [Eubacterium limosum]